MHDTVQVSPLLESHHSLNRPSPAHHSPALQQPYPNHLPNPAQPIYSSQWAQPSHLSQYTLEPSPFQVLSTLQKLAKALDNFRCTWKWRLA